MCFTPAISLTTAVIEFIVATFILIRYKRYVVPVFLAILVYILGIYQFTEFVLCTSNNPLLWAKLGFIAYTFLPAIGLHFALRLAKNKMFNWALYILPILFTILAAVKENFILYAGCSKLFVTSITTGSFPGYGWYYFGFIAITVIIGFILFVKEKDKVTKKLGLLIGFGTIIIIALPIILILILPSLSVQFPSVYCKFALLYTILAVWSAKVYHRKKKKEKF